MLDTSAWVNRCDRVRRRICSGISDGHRARDYFIIGLRSIIASRCIRSLGNHKVLNRDGLRGDFQFILHLIQQRSQKADLVKLNSEVCAC